jgi:hypothetical protein
MNKYYCTHCKNIILRDSNKKWIASYCDKTDRKVRLQLKKEEYERDI